MEKTQITQASMRAFMAHLIDYAGMFPPAALPLAEAFAHYTRFLGQDDRWMLGRFIVPAARLEELSGLMTSPSMSENGFGDGLTFSALGRGGADLNEFIQRLRLDLEAISAFRARHEHNITLDVYEVKLPVTHDRALLADLMLQATQLMEWAGGLTVYYEVPELGDDWQARVEIALQSITENQPAAGFKLRCGGAEPAEFPSPQQVAFTLRACEAQWVSLKATAGLHHPFRHYNDGVRTKMHGFINLFAAGMLGYFYNLNQEQITAILEDENPYHFRFEADDFIWKGVWRISVDSINTARQTVLTSFGSCSFDEPREDLRNLGLLA